MASAKQTKAEVEKIDHSYLWRWVNLPFFAMHLTPLLIIWTGSTWADWVLCIGMYYGRIFLITGIYHRYFGHSTFELNRFWQFVFAFLAQTTAQKGVLWWASNHKAHHRYSDKPEDPHSMKLKGFWYSHVGWILDSRYDETRYDLIQRYAKYPELVWLNKYHLVPPVLAGLVIYLVGGASALVVGFLLSTVLVWHGTFTINSLSHWRGSRRYKTDDASKNNIWLNFLTLGEGWHNNHHYYQNSARLGFFWWEIDVGWYGLKVLSWLGIVKNMREVSPSRRDSAERLLGKPETRAA